LQTATATAFVKQHSCQSSSAVKPNFYGCFKRGRRTAPDFLLLMMSIGLHVLALGASRGPLTAIGVDPLRV
jgi:hypothetical protein